MNQSKAAAAHPDVIAGGVLDALITYHPAQLSFEELVRALADDPGEFRQRDSVHVALSDRLRSAPASRFSGDLVDRFLEPHHRRNLGDCS